MRLSAVAVLLLSVCLPLGTLAPGSARAAESAGDLARQGLAECEAGRRSTARDDRQAHFERGKVLGSRAVALDDNSADAHFTVFCNQGELMRLDGESLSSVLELRNLLAELDRTLQLDPNHTGAMAAKGQFLLRLPRLLGGDPSRG